MKKLIILFNFLAFAFTASATNNVENSLAVKSNDKKEHRQNKKKNLNTDVCTRCVWWPGGGACGTGETCVEALICCWLSLE